MDNKHKRQYPSQAQKNRLVEILEADADLRSGKFSSNFTKKTAASRWVQIAQELNAINGANKTAKEWRSTWIDMKSYFKKKNAGPSLNGSPPEDSKSQSLDRIILSSISEEALVSHSDSQELVGNVIVKDEKLGPQRTSMEKKYKAVLKCCINLVKVHGRPVEIFDDKAFQDLLDMIPITVKERRMLTADNIKMMIEEGNSGDVDDDDNDEWDNSLDSRDHLADDDSTPIRIKKELVKCSCPTRSDSDATTHAQDCPKYMNPTYWSLFSVSVEDATCTLCGDVIMWSELSELKRHLTSKHPDVNFVDDDDQFSRGPPSSVGSREDQDELVLPEDLQQQPEPSEPKKSTIIPRLSRASRKMLSQPYYRKIAPKPAAVFCVQGAPTNPIDKPFIERCKSLDTFGAYIASLMKLLPEDVCTKLQRQIVDRVLAAAG